MTEVKSTAAVANAAKKHRRGITNETVAVSQLKFDEKDAARNGLFIATLSNVSVEWSQNAEAKTFTGLRMPRLVFEFTSTHSNPKERRHVYQTLFPVESNVDTIPGGKSAWQVDNIFNYVKHFLDVFYLKGRDLTPEEEDMLAIDIDDYTEDENGNIEYNAVEPEKVLDGYRALFENVANMMNGNINLVDNETPKPCYKTPDGKPIQCWIKLIRCIRNKDGKWRTVVNKNQDLGFPTFLGSGVVELVKGSGANLQMPSIVRLDLAKESITPKKLEEAPSIGVPGMPIGMNSGMVVPAAATGVFNDTPTDNPAFAGAGEDLPF